MQAAVHTVDASTLPTADLHAPVALMTVGPNQEGVSHTVEFGQIAAVIINTTTGAAHALPTDAAIALAHAFNHYSAGIAEYQASQASAPDGRGDDGVKP